MAWVLEANGAVEGSAWLPAPAAALPGAAEVHVWRASLDQAVPRVGALLETLQPDERERAARFRFEDDRNRFIAARGILRDILARALGSTPGAVRFVYGPWGKPALAEPAPGDLQFNLSHSGGLALYALTCGRAVGIDVERIRPEVMREGIARRFFSPREVAALERLPEAERCAGFFRCWTRKEAYVKATGRGLLLPLDSFDVSLAPGEPAALLGTRPDPAEACRWSLMHLEPGNGWVGALAVEGHGLRLRCFEWAPADSPA